MVPVANMSQEVDKLQVVEVLSPQSYPIYYSVKMTLYICDLAIVHEAMSQQTQNICITFVECWANVEDVGPTLYKYYTNVLCLLGWRYVTKVIL